MFASTNLGSENKSILITDFEKYWQKLASENNDIQKVRTMTLTNKKTHNKFITNYVDNISMISQIFIIRKSIE